MHMNFAARLPAYRPSRLSAAVVLCLWALIASACSQPERPTRDECVRGFKNFIRLMTKDNPKRAAFMKKAESTLVKSMAGKFVKSRKRAVVLCEIKAESLAALKACRKQP